MKVTAIYCYPIKSLRGIGLDNARATRTGFPHDRRFMLQRVVTTDHSGAELAQPTYKNMAIATYGKMALFHQEFCTGPLGSELLVTFHDPQTGTRDQLQVPLDPKVTGLKQHDIEMHKAETKAYLMGSKYDEFFSRHFGFDVVFVYIGPHHRPVLGNLNPPSDKPAGWSTAMFQQIPVLGSYLKEEPAEIDFADVAAYLVTTEESLANVSARLPDGEEMDMRKFRPNIVLSGSPEEWDEDFWGEIEITPSSGDDAISLLFTANCGRCNSINVDFATGRNGTGPSGRILNTLREDRCVDPGQKRSPVFGRYGFLTRDTLQKGGGEISLGDEVALTRRNIERTVMKM